MVKTQKAADRDFSGALFNQNFPYSTKNLTRSFSFKLVKMRCGFHARDSHSLGGAYFLKTVLNHKKFFGRIRPSWLSSCAAILIGGSWKRFLKGPSFHTDFWAFFVCALTVSIWKVGDFEALNFRLSTKFYSSHKNWFYYYFAYFLYTLLCFRALFFVVSSDILFGKLWLVRLHWVV